MRGPGTLFSMGQIIAQADIGPGAACNHFVVSSACTIGVEISPPYLMLDQITPCRTLDGNIACRCHMICRDGSTEGNQHTCRNDILQWLWFGREICKKGRFSYIGRVRGPAIGRAGGDHHLLPLAISLIDLGVFPREQVLVDSCLNDMLYLRR